MPTIELPYNWKTRDYQKKLWSYMAGGGKRAIAVWPRRHGKDDIALHWAATAAHTRIGNYIHMLPQANQARKAIWDAVNPHSGKRRIDEAFPPEIRDNVRDQDMFIRLKCGSTWQVAGSDNYMNVLGSAPAGVAFSEYAYGDPNAWGALRPILLENNGWAMFISTPGGQNHYHKLYEFAKDDPEWFAQLLTYKDAGVFTEDQIDQERREIAAEVGNDEADALIAQWYMCSFHAPMPGSYYGRLIVEAEADGRITKLPYNPAYPVETHWDIGHNDSTAIWFRQRMPGGALHYIDYHEETKEDASHYASVLRNKRYSYKEHVLPHDAKQHHPNYKYSFEEVLRDQNIGPVRVLSVKEGGSPETGLGPVRILLPRCYFDADKCKHGIEALRSYRAKPVRNGVQGGILHDWASHGADAFRYSAVTYKEERKRMRRPAQYAIR